MRPDEATQREASDNASLEQLLHDRVGTHDNCVDVGANEGRFLAAMVAAAPHGQHVAFEPIPQLADDLRARFPGVDVHGCALASTQGAADYVLVPESMGYSGLRARTYPDAYETRTIRVLVARLDDMLDPERRVRVLKVDVEGGELGVFQGAIATLERWHPLIVFEHGIGAADHYGTTPEDVHDLLTGLGYGVWGLGDDARPYARGEFVDAFHAGLRWNWLAR